MLHFVLHDSFNPSINNPLYLNNLHRFSHSLYLYISFYRPYAPERLPPRSCPTSTATAPTHGANRRDICLYRRLR